MIKTHAMKKTQEDFFNKYIYLSLYCKGSKTVVWGSTVRGSSNITAIFWPNCYGRQRCVFLVLQGCSIGDPGPTLLGDSFLYCILSAPSLVPNSSGPKPLQPRVAFPTTPRLQLAATQLAVELNSTGTQTPLAHGTQLSYIIVWRSLNLWNRMFNRHQAEITVMQFRDHSLPVRQSMRVSWDFLACPILLANFRPRDFLS